MKIKFGIKWIGLILLVTLVSLSGSADTKEESLENTLEYRITIDASESAGDSVPKPIYNATFYLPLPVRDGEPLKINTSEWDTEVVETECVKMLKEGIGKGNSPGNLANLRPGRESIS